MSSTPYDRQTSFALFSAENPTKQQSGASLDAEFNAVKIALDDTQQNLAKIQDDDGALKRSSVGRAQFDASVSIGFAAPSQWASGTLYTEDVNTVFHESIFYIASVTHTSGASFEPDKWDEIADFTAAVALTDGSITSAKLADGAVAANKLADGVVANTKLATGAVTTNKVADNAITTTKVADAAISFAKLGTDGNQVIPAGLGPLPWSGKTLPAGWDWADGAVLLPNTPFTTLRARYIADGFPFGQDGSGNPKKPDARGCNISCSDDLGSGAAGRLTSAAIPGGANHGSRGGTETVTLTTSQIPSHTHSNSLNDPGHAHSQQFGVRGYSTSGVAQAFAGAPGVDGTVSYPPSAATTGLTITNAAAGGGAAHSNVAPTLICNMIIKAH